MIMHYDSLQKLLATCVAVLVICMNGIAAHAETPADLEAQELARVARAQEHHDADALVALADEYQARWKRGEHGDYILRALDKLATAVATWEWDDFGKQIELPIEVGLFVLEHAPADAPLEVQVHMALCVAGAPDQHKPSFTAAERKRRALLASQVLHRVLAKVDPTVDLSAPVWLNVPVPNGVVDSGSSPSAIKDPALRAEYERRIRENASLIRKRGEQSDVLSWKRRLLLSFEPYLIAVYSPDPNHFYSPGPDAGPELDKILAEIKESAKGKGTAPQEVDAMIARIKTAVAAALTATQPAG